MQTFTRWYPQKKKRFPKEVPVMPRLSFDPRSSTQNEKKSPPPWRSLTAKKNPATQAENEAGMHHSYCREVEVNLEFVGLSVYGCV